MRGIDWLMPLHGSHQPVADRLHHRTAVVLRTQPVAILLALYSRSQSDQLPGFQILLHQYRPAQRYPLMRQRRVQQQRIVMVGKIIFPRRSSIPT